MEVCYRLISRVLAKLNTKLECTVAAKAWRDVERGKGRQDSPGD